MEPGRNFPLRKGTLLTCISWRNAINNPHLNLYFTSPAEAIVSMFREAIVRPFELTIGQPGLVAQNTNDVNDLYLNTFYLTEDIVINPLPNSNLQRELNQDPTLNEVREAIQLDCGSVPDRMGYVIPYLSSIDDPEEDIMIHVRITAYIICRPNILLHTQSFVIFKSAVQDMLGELIIGWRDRNRGLRIAGGVIVDILDKTIRGVDRQWYLEPVYTQPEVPGLATSPVQYDPPVTFPQISPIARLPISAEEEFIISPTIQIEEPPRPIVPPSSLLAPQDPTIFIPQRLSPGGTTALDAFTDVPGDVVRVIALGMTLDALANTCVTSRRFNTLICNSEDFWRLRLQQDFGKQFSQDKDEQVFVAARRKPQGWTWKRYYAELSGNVTEANALDFADQLKDLDEDVLVELRRLPREQYRERVNEMRVQAGLGPIKFLPDSPLDAFQHVGGIDDRRRVGVARAGDEADVFYEPPRQPGQRAGQLPPRNLFRVQPMVGPGVMGPVVEENPDVNAEAPAPGGLINRDPNDLFRQIREDRRLMEAYQRLARRMDGHRRGARRPQNLLRQLVEELANQPGELMANLETNFENMRLQYPQEWQIADEAVIREAIQNYIAERQLDRERAGFNMDFDGDEIQVQVPQRRGYENVPAEVELRFILYNDLWDALRADDIHRIADLTRNIYADLQVRGGNLDPLERLQRDLAQITQYPVLINQWPIDTTGRITRIVDAHQRGQHQIVVAPQPIGIIRDRQERFAFLAGELKRWAVRLRNRQNLQQDVNRFVERIIDNAGFIGVGPRTVLRLVFEELEMDYPQMFGTFEREEIEILRRAFALYEIENPDRMPARPVGQQPQMAVMGPQPIPLRAPLVDEARFNLYRRLIGARAQGDAATTRRLLDELFLQRQLQNRGIDIAIDTFEEDMLQMGQRLDQQSQETARQAVEDYVVDRIANQVAVVINPQPNDIPIPNDVMRLFRMYSRLLQAIRQEDENATRDRIDDIYEGRIRRAAPGADMRDHIRADMELFLNEYPNLARRWPRGSLDQIRNILLLRFPEARQAFEPQRIGPRPPEPPLARFNLENPPLAVTQNFEALQQLLNLRRRDQEAYEQLRNELFERILNNVNRQNRAAIDFLQNIINEVIQYPRYVDVLDDFPLRLMNQFREYLNHPQQPVNLVLFHEARQYIPGFQQLLDPAMNNRPIAGTFRILQDAFGRIYTEAGENQQDSAEVLASILQRLAESPIWDSDNDAQIMGIFNGQYLPLVRGLGELITIFREIIDDRERIPTQRLRDNAITAILRFREQNPLYANDIFTALGIFTELHQLNGRVLWRPDRDRALLERKLRL